MDLTRRAQELLAHLGVPVLSPDEFELPRRAAERTPAGRIKAGGAQGLSVYLAEHSSGYVQLHEPQGFLGVLDGAGALSLMQVDALGPDRESAYALAARIRRALSSYPGVRTTPFELFTPAAARPLADGVGHVFSTTYQGREALDP